MRSLSTRFGYVGFCALALGLPPNTLAQDGQQFDPRPVTVNQAATATASPVANPAISELPDSPGTLWAHAQDASPQQTASPQKKELRVLRPDLSLTRPVR